MFISSAERFLSGVVHRHCYHRRLLVQRVNFDPSSIGLRALSLSVAAHAMSFNGDIISHDDIARPASGAEPVLRRCQLGDSVSDGCSSTTFARWQDQTRFLEATAVNLFLSIAHPAHSTASPMLKAYICGVSSTSFDLRNSGSVHAVPGYKLAVRPANI